MPSSTPQRSPLAPHQRPSLTQRTSSTGSASVNPHSLSNASDTSSSHRPQQHRPQRHVVGGRLGARNTSFGNLSKLTARAGGAGDGHGPRGNRTHKVADVARSTSPRPGMKRNSTTGGAPRQASHSALKKNFSSGNLPRHGSSKALKNAARHGLAPLTKRTRSHQSDKSETSNMTADDEDEVEIEVEQPSPPPPQPVPDRHTVRFDLGNGKDDQEDDWTEESGTASPLTTRDHTRQSSVSGEAGHLHPKVNVAEPVKYDSHVEFSQSEEPPLSQREDDEDQQEKPVPTITHASTPYHPSRPPDPDDITSRLLQGRASNLANAQVSNVSVIADHPPDSPAHDLSRSYVSPTPPVGSTPGRDLVSRFIHSNGASAVGTPASTFINTQGQLIVNGDKPAEGSAKRARFEPDTIKRNQSMPAMAALKSKSPDSISPSSTLVAKSTDTMQSRKSGSRTPTDLPPSRTEQKLLLQRASSVIEPQKHLPAMLPRPGAPPLFGHQAGLALGSARLLGDGNANEMMPIQIQALFQEAGKEYSVIRRFRVPVGESLRRLAKRGVLPKATQANAAATAGKQAKTPQSSADAGVRSAKEALKDREQVGAPARGSRPPSLRQPSAPALTRRDPDGRPAPLNRAQTSQHQGRARVSFELPQQPTTPRSLSRRNSASDGISEGDEEDSPGRLSRSPRTNSERDEAFEICRRLWEGVMGLDAHQDALQSQRLPGDGESAAPQHGTSSGGVNTNLVMPSAATNQPSSAMTRQPSSGRVAFANVQ